jgi:arginine decarboxylase
MVRKSPSKPPSAAQSTTAPWSIAQSREFYGVGDWGEGFFDINPAGELVAQARFGNTVSQAAVIDVIEGMKARGMDMPSVLRIENVLDNRIQALNEAFRRAIKEYNYRNEYRGVFPVKVNQQCHVIEEISDFGARYHHGLEVGSKAELIIALSKLRESDSLIICNGYKDSEFIELGLYARKMGLRCFFVLETPSELPVILQSSAKLGIEPLLGVRIRPSVVVDGHWNEGSGDRSIFGLSTASLIRVIEQLKQADMLHCLQLLHCHLGSQIPNIRNIRSGVLEACRFYSGLIEQGAPMGYLDLGGGLAVDYEGTRSNHVHSMNYRLDEYCVNIVETICECFDPLEIPHPVIVSESGRSTVAYSSMLLFNVLDVRDHRPVPLPEKLPRNTHELVQSLWEVNQSITADNFQECYNDALFYRDEVRELFRWGQVSLADRALADNITLAVLEQVATELKNNPRHFPELEDLPEMLADTYYGNFSLFQSLPDAWAVNQVFPVMPIHRLQEEPDRDAVIADITCDCDGKIDHFSIERSIRRTTRLHSVHDDQEYYLGVFLVGAYQETLGDLHNLFGDTNVVSVRINPDGSYDFVREFHGDSIADVLSYVEYDTRRMTEEFRQRAENAVREGRIDAATRKQMMQAFKESLDGYTYYEKEEH